MMNKKGALVLRNVMFMVIIFAGLMILIGIFVESMATEYGNDGMNEDYQESIGGIGDNMFLNINDSIRDMKSDTDGGKDTLLGSFTSLTGVIWGAASIFGKVISAPLFIGESIELMLIALNVPASISQVVSNIINLLIYVLIIFVIVSALLKGGKV